MGLSWVHEKNITSTSCWEKRRSQLSPVLPLGYELASKTPFLACSEALLLTVRTLPTRVDAILRSATTIFLLLPFYYPRICTAPFLSSRIPFLCVCTSFGLVIQYRTRNLELESRKNQAYLLTPHSVTSLRLFVQTQAALECNTGQKSLVANDKSDMNEKRTHHASAEE